MNQYVDVFKRLRNFYPIKLTCAEGLLQLENIWTTALEETPFIVGTEEKDEKSEPSEEGKAAQV